MLRAVDDDGNPDPDADQDLSGFAVQVPHPEVSADGAFRLYGLPEDGWSSSDDGSGIDFSTDGSSGSAELELVHAEPEASQGEFNPGETVTVEHDITC